MNITMLYSKIHRATVTDANLNYVGSITIDQELLDAANMRVGQKIDIVNVNNVVGINADGTNNFHPMNLNKFIDHMSPYIEKQGFYQKGFTTQVDDYNKIAEEFEGLE